MFKKFFSVLFTVTLLVLASSTLYAGERQPINIFVPASTIPKNYGILYLAMEDGVNTMKVLPVPNLQKSL
jgi:hypothetical protein